MIRVTVIGLGSPFGDDRAGWEVAERLAASARVRGWGPGVAVRLCRAPVSELPNWLAATEVAILVDAVRANGAAGTMYRLSRPHPALLDEPRLSTHGLGVRAALELLQSLGEAPREWLLYGIELGRTDAGHAEGDAAVARAVVRVTEAVADELDARCRRR